MLSAFLLAIVMYLLDIKLVTMKTTRNALYTSHNAKYIHQDASRCSGIGQLIEQLHFIEVE